MEFSDATDIENVLRQPGTPRYALFLKSQDVCLVVLDFALRQAVELREPFRRGSRTLYAWDFPDRRQGVPFALKLAEALQPAEEGSFSLDLIPHKVRRKGLRGNVGLKSW